MNCTELLHPEELHRLLTKVDKQQAHISELERKLAVAREALQWLNDPILYDPELLDVDKNHIQPWLKAQTALEQIK